MIRYFNLKFYKMLRAKNPISPGDHILPLYLNILLFILFAQKQISAFFCQ